MSIFNSLILPCLTWLIKWGLRCVSCGKVVWASLGRGSAAGLLGLNAAPPLPSNEQKLNTRSWKNTYFCRIECNDKIREEIYLAMLRRRKSKSNGIFFMICAILLYKKISHLIRRKSKGDFDDFFKNAFFSKMVSFEYLKFSTIKSYGGLVPGVSGSRRTNFFENPGDFFSGIEIDQT